MHLLLLTTILFYHGSFAFNVRRDALSDCLAGGNVPILMTSSPLWSEAIEPFNLRLQPSPNIVAIPRNNDEVMVQNAD